MYVFVFCVCLFVCEILRDVRRGYSLGSSGIFWRMLNFAADVGLSRFYCTEI